MVKKRLDHLILAEGEATGHAHRASAGVLYNENAEMLWQAPEGAAITHEEHAQQTALWPELIVRRVLELDHASEQVRATVD